MRDAIKVDQVYTRFGDKVVHRGIDFVLPDGEILGLVGASGSGKTTLLREIIGLQSPTSGCITVMGRPVNGAVGQTQALSMRMGVLFQKGALFSALNVFENIAFPLREAGLQQMSLLSRLVAMQLRRVGLKPDDAWLMPSELSGGMIKRVALARALVLDPDLLILDEPTSGLDPIASQSFVELLNRLHAKLHFTVVMVTHDLDVLKRLCTQVAVLAEQRLIAFGPLAEVLRCDHSFVREFFYNEHARKVLA
ncbi:MAG: ATP-binding cassette domain-containing protein [Methylococcales bacterium]|nr:ATP-binding cassette domain-containing protein [Methylococcales bacterium]